MTNKKGERASSCNSPPKDIGSPYTSQIQTIYTGLIKFKTTCYVYMDLKLTLHVAMIGENWQVVTNEPVEFEK